MGVRVRVRERERERERETEFEGLDIHICRRELYIARGVWSLRKDAR